MELLYFSLSLEFQSISVGYAYSHGRGHSSRALFTPKIQKYVFLYQLLITTVLLMFPKLFGTNASYNMNILCCNTHLDFNFSYYYYFITAYPLAFLYGIALYKKNPMIQVKSFVHKSKLLRVTISSNSFMLLYCYLRG